MARKLAKSNKSRDEYKSMFWLKNVLKNDIEAQMVELNIINRAINYKELGNPSFVTPFNHMSIDQLRQSRIELIQKIDRKEKSLNEVASAIDDYYTDKAVIERESKEINSVPLGSLTQSELFKTINNE